MGKDMATCIVCGKTYKTCLSCKHLDVIKPWRSIADNVVCYKIFLVVSQYNSGHISKEEAKRQLNELKFDVKELKPSIQNSIAEITSVPETAKKIVPKGTVDKNVNSNLKE